MKGSEFAVNVTQGVLLGLVAFGVLGLSLWEGLIFVASLSIVLGLEKFPHENL